MNIGLKLKAESNAILIILDISVGGEGQVKSIPLNAINSSAMETVFSYLNEDEIGKLGQTESCLLADIADNPGGGAQANSTAVLDLLMHNQHNHGLIGILVAPEVVREAFQAGLGGTVKLSQVKNGLATKVQYPCKILALSDGNFSYQGQMFEGLKASLGACALLETSGVHIFASSNRLQFIDPSMFSIFKVSWELKDYPLIVVKSAIHFLKGFGDFPHKIKFCNLDGDFKVPVHF
ncbi:MAG: hypothetical protein A2X86_10970 [Bdellovibrionales bacterium GWA2_49_15]|nr:MAG: hypothetical protein A2X86_10970 [Bdellovibrionales bacterium GWA2_49_15]HAZ11498.1 hypothetical protein [Bdellovibrionales bacterium]